MTVGGVVVAVPYVLVNLTYGLMPLADCRRINGQRAELTMQPHRTRVVSGASEISLVSPVGSGVPP